MTLCRYIRMSQADQWIADGWRVTPCMAHRGARGFGIASLSKTARRVAQKKRQRRRLFEQQHGLCHWCGQPMHWAESHQEGLRQDACTIEHLDSRLSGLRKPGKPARVVAACRRCNETRGRQEVANLTKAELHERCSRPPKGQREVA